MPVGPAMDGPPGDWKPANVVARAFHGQDRPPACGLRLTLRL